MRLERFDMNLLVALDVLLEERSVTRASERLFIGQSACSGALARLREYFGDELLVPVGRRLMLTPLAETLVEPVRDTLLRARATLARKPQFDPTTAQRRFLVCASDYVTTVMLASAMRKIAALAPGVVIEIRSPSPQSFESLDRGSIDLMVMPQQYAQQVEHPRSAWFHDEQACLVWTGNTQVGETLDFEQYMSLGHVAVRFGDERSLTFEEWFLPRHGKQRRIEATVDNFSTLPLLLIETHRIATLHRRLAEYVSQYLPLRVITPPIEMPLLTEMIFWPKYLDLDPAHQWFRTILLESTNQKFDDRNDH
jgi:LysR family transcriptional regulator, nod-box dependent transcriptional activator